MKVAFITVNPPSATEGSVTPAVIGLLREWGLEVTLIRPDAELIDLHEVRVEHDLYVLKSGTELALSLAGMLDALGATMINPYPVTARCRDKIVATRILQSAGVPVPKTFLAVHPSQLAPLLDHGPLVVKPHRGSKGRGVQVVWDADELGDVATAAGPIFAQRYHEPTGRDRKLYCMGGQLFGVKRVWPVRNYDDKLGEPFTVTSELHEIATRAGKAFGIDLFGLDIIVSDGRPFVVDVNPFPGFKGVPDAALRLADYVYDATRRAVDAAQRGGAAA